jgi:N-acetylglucosaminyldiphosphoundecaprenol N-acetyl-beta-D-mannosaminyltransferase
MPAAAAGGRVLVAGVRLDRLTEEQVVQRVLSQLAAGNGGWVATLNVDICRAVHRDPALCALVGEAPLAVPDGMPLLWAARLLGTRLADRVTGSSLIFSLSEAAARAGRSVYLLGGEPGVPEQADRELCRRYPDLKVAGTDAPPPGFDATDAGIDAVLGKLATAAADIVFVGLGFPKQEKLIARLGPALPGAWFVACGAAIPFAAGALPRAPRWMQRFGLEWLFRLLSEPRRLFRRYLVDDLPFAVALLAASAGQRLAAAVLQARRPALSATLARDRISVG